MDETFQSPNVNPQPPPGKMVEVWHGGACIKGYKRDGSWHAEDGTNITIEGWRMIGAKPAVAPQAAPTFKDDDDRGSAKPTIHPRPRHK